MIVINLMLSDGEYNLLTYLLNVIRLILDSTLSLVIAKVFQGVKDDYFVIYENLERKFQNNSKLSKKI